MMNADSSIPHDTRIRVMPITIWLAVQIIALIIAAANLPLYARPDQPTSQIAPTLLLATQSLILSLLFPLILRDVKQSSFIVACTLPFVVLAGVMAQSAVSSVWIHIGFIVLGIAGLSMWKMTLTTRSAQLIAVAIASNLLIGGAIVMYLLKEFADTRFMIRPTSKEVFAILIINLGIAATSAVVARRSRAKLSTAIC